MLGWSNAFISLKKNGYLLLGMYMEVFNVYLLPELEKKGWGWVTFLDCNIDRFRTFAFKS